jgi:uncharacterized membrane protein
MEQLPPVTPPQPGAGDAAADDYVWTYRGYKMRPAEFNTAWVHYYRAEIQRSNTWRTRLDATTNWAVVTVAAAISFSLSSPNNHFGVIIIDIFLVALFLWIEARRYRYYELWSYRARLIEVNFFAALLVPPARQSNAWAEDLAASLREPKFSIGMLEAIGRRLRRNYLWIFFVLDAAWALKSYIHPAPSLDLTEFINRSSIGDIPGIVVVILGLLFNAGLIFLAVYTLRLRNANGEVGEGGVPPYPAE